MEVAIFIQSKVKKQNSKKRKVNKGVKQLDPTALIRVYTNQGDNLPAIVKPVKTTTGKGPLRRI